MTTPAHRTKEFKVRQVYYLGNFVTQLKKVKGIFHYVTSFYSSGSEKLYKLDEGMYNNEDPLLLIQIGKSMVGVQKLGYIKLSPELFHKIAKKGIKTYPIKKKLTVEGTGK